MEEKKVCPGCCHKTKDRPEKEYKDLMNRLSRIEGQVRGVRRMVEEGAYWSGYSDSGICGECGSE